MAIEGAPVDVLTEQITTAVEEVVEESTQTIIMHFPKDDKNALSQDTHRLFGQIERGLMVEFRTQPGGKAEDKDALKASKRNSDNALSRGGKGTLTAGEWANQTDKLRVTESR